MKSEPLERGIIDRRPVEVRDRSAYLWQLTKYYLKLGAVGFGGPVALVGFMHRDLVEQRRWVSEDTYKLALALAQIMPGPLAAQLAIAIGYFEAGVLGAAFILPSFLMVIVISLLYVTYGGLWWDAGAVLFHRRGSNRDHRHRRL